MFRILESIAAIEISKDPKKFNEEKIKHQHKEGEVREDTPLKTKKKKKSKKERFDPKK